MSSRVKTHVKKGDQVQVISGVHKGAVGKVLQVVTKKNQVLVEGVRMIKKHVRKSQDRPQGGIIEREMPFAACKVMPVDPTTGKPTRVRIADQDGNKVRIAKSGAVIK